MPNFAGNSVISKAKSMFSKRLLPADYEELLKFNSIPEIVAYLKKADKYTNTLDKVMDYSMHRGQLEDLIKKSYFNNVVKIVNFVSTKDRKFYELDMVKREIEIVLSSLRSIISGNIESSIRDLPLFFRKHASFDIEELTKSLTFRDLLFALKNTRYYDVIRPFYAEDPIDIRYTDIEQSMFLAYHNLVIERINKYFKGKIRTNLMDIYQTKVEVDNIIKIYRLKKFYNASEEEIKKALIMENIRMKKADLENLIRLSDPNDVLMSISQSIYASYIDEDDYVYIEYQAEKIKYNIARRYMYFSTVPAIVYTVFIFLNEIEQKNIFNIIEGIRYDIKKDDIRKMLIY
ncbi:MAG: V-type ATPase subunit [Candidatus Izemoplasmatales bacterium]|nr:V-type ATPase subunit [Candidatus Izemoplasmatales bacterium]